MAGEKLLGKNWIANEDQIRKIYNPPRDIQYLYLLREGIIAEASKSVCETTPENISGSLVIATMYNDLREIYTSGNQAIPERLMENPITVISNLPCYIKNSSGYIPLNEFAPTTIIKHALGALSGVITDGRYAGMIVTPIIKNEQYVGLNLKRMYNDTMIEFTTPYSFTNQANDYSLESIESSTDVLALQLFRKKYQLYTQDFTWHSEFLAYMTSTLGIPFNIQRFAYTRFDEEKTRLFQNLIDNNPQQTAAFLEKLDS